MFCDQNKIDHFSTLIDRENVFQWNSPFVKCKETITNSCKEGWRLFQYTGLCYRYFATQHTWKDARIRCQLSAPQNKIGDLASISDATTNRFVSCLAPGYAWIGGQQNEMGDWTWSDGTQWGYENWAQGQPSSSVRSEDIKNYLGINFGCKGRWNDWTVNVNKEWHHNVRGFVCQYK